MKRYSLIINGHHCGLVCGDDIKVKDCGSRIWIYVMFQGKDIYSMHYSSEYGTHLIEDNTVDGCELGTDYLITIKDR